MDHKDIINVGPHKISIDIDKLNQFVGKFIEGLKQLMETIRRVCEVMKEFFRKYIRFIYKIPPGYRRLSKEKDLKYYESISAGKSNNWRKMHGIVLIRNAC